MQPVQRALVDLAGDRDLALLLEAADGLDRGGVVRAGDVAEQPGDRDQAGLQVADLLAAGAGLEDRGARVEHVEQLVVRRLLRHLHAAGARWSRRPRRWPSGRASPGSRSRRSWWRDRRRRWSAPGTRRAGRAGTAARAPSRRGRPARGGTRAPAPAWASGSRRGVGSGSGSVVSSAVTGASVVARWPVSSRTTYPTPYAVAPSRPTVTTARSTTRSAFMTSPRCERNFQCQQEDARCRDLVACGVGRDRLVAKAVPIVHDVLVVDQARERPDRRGLSACHPGQTTPVVFRRGPRRTRQAARRRTPHVRRGGASLRRDQRRAVDGPGPALAARGDRGGRPEAR